MFKKIPHSTSGEILTRAGFAAQADDGLDPAMTPAAVLDALATPETIVDYIRFFAHAVPPREGICWSLAVIVTLCPAQTADEIHALDQVTAWLRDPSETRRRDCMAMADKLGNEGPVGWLCLAVGWCGSGSIVAGDLPEVLPPMWLHAKAVFGATALCLPDRAEDRAAPTQSIDALARRVADGFWPHLHPEEDR